MDNKVSQLLRNYSFMLSKELKRMSKDKDKNGNIEFYNEERRRIEQALKD